MKFRILERLQRRFGRFALHNLTLALIAGQVAVFLLTYLRPDAAGGQPGMLQRLVLVPSAVLHGQFWRLLTVLFIPPLTHPIFALFFWYLFYLMGTALESFWGAFRYNVYLAIGYVATVAVSFVTPDVPVTNGFLYGSVFLAFAFLNPDFTLALFFILPVKIKWLALLTWIFFGYELLVGNATTALAVLASICNFLLFFSGEIRQRVVAGRRRMAAQATQFAASNTPFHRCRVCGITDKTHPQTEFRYCSKCAGTCGYCPEHIRNHEHVTAPRDPTPGGSL